jgi:hypothetical protein
MRPLHSRRSRSKLTDAHQFRERGSFGSQKEDYLSDADRMSIVDEVVKQLLDVTKRHFPRTANLEYAILKAHLIIENAVLS